MVALYASHSAIWFRRSYWIEAIERIWRERSGVDHADRQQRGRRQHESVAQRGIRGQRALGVRRKHPRHAAERDHESGCADEVEPVPGTTAAEIRDRPICGAVEAGLLPLSGLSKSCLVDAHQMTETQSGPHYA